MKNKSLNKTILSSIILLGLIAFVVHGFMNEKDNKDIIKERGNRSIGFIYDGYRPHKGNVVLQYYFYVDGIKFHGSTSKDANYPTSIGEKRIVVYDSINPKLNRMLLHEKVIDSLDINKFESMPIEFK